MDLITHLLVTYRALGQYPRPLIDETDAGLSSENTAAMM
jgi:hypothetical protein